MISITPDRISCRGGTDELENIKRMFILVEKMFGKDHSVVITHTSTEYVEGRIVKLEPDNSYGSAIVSGMVAKELQRRASAICNASAVLAGNVADLSTNLYGSAAALKAVNSMVAKDLGSALTKRAIEYGRNDSMKFNEEQVAQLKEYLKKREKLSEKLTKVNTMIVDIIGFDSQVSVRVDGSAGKTHQLKTDTVYEEYLKGDIIDALRNYSAKLSKAIEELEM